MKKSKSAKNEENSFWEEGSFAETLSSDEAEERMKTFHKGHDEDMNFNCKECNRKISTHNKDWHAGMCDGCFDKKVYGKQNNYKNNYGKRANDKNRHSEQVNGENSYGKQTRLE